MTTAPTNEMLALADRLKDAVRNCARDSHYKYCVMVSVPEVEQITSALRLAATPARDVREALEQVVKDAFNVGVEQGKLTPGKTWPSVQTELIGWLDRALNLDAAAPAAGGDEVSVELMQRIWLNLYYNEEEAGGTFQRTLNDVVDWLARRNSLPTSAPPLQAPAHSEAVRAIPRNPTSSMMDAGLYHCSADMTWADLFTAWQAMFDAVALDGGISDILPAALTAPAAKAAQSSEKGE